MTKYKERGYEIQVGDKIEASIMSAYRRIDVVTRVTKTMAICEGDGTTRYPRVYGFYFHVLPYSRSNMQWNVLDE